MKKNLTVKIDERLVKECRHAAVEDDSSVSQWVSKLIEEALGSRNRFNESRRTALKYLEVGFKLGGSPLKRDEIYDK